MISRNGSKYLNSKFFKYLYVSLVVAHADCSLTKKGESKVGDKQSKGEIFVSFFWVGVSLYLFGK